MKLATFVYRGETHIGALTAWGSRPGIFDLNRAVPTLPADMTEFLKAGDSAWDSARRALAFPDERNFIPAEEVTLLAPVPRPGKIIGVGYNYYDHTGGGQARPDLPTFFAKFSNVVIGPNQPIVYPRFKINLDYEGELAVVIGRPARYVAEDRALDFVAGYTIFNDVTARDYQNMTSQWTLGKSFDTFGPMGPVLVSADELPDPGHLELVLTVNGEERQHSNTCNLIFTIPFLISYLSQAMTLEPGDLISTGTPGKLGPRREPPVFMQPGDQVKVRIEGIGELANPIVAEAALN